MKLSACWIVKNEADTLALSMDSVRDVVDELIVVDTGSTDRSVDVALERGARIEHFTWIHDFSAARNYVLSIATGDVIIFLDADEYFRPALTQNDRELILNAFQNPKVDVLRIPRTNIDQKTGLIIATDIMVRILRGNGVLEYRHKIHEFLHYLDGSFPKATYIPQLNIDHTGYSKNVAGQKAERNVEILESELDAEEDSYKRFLLQSYLMREYAALRQYENAYRFLRELMLHSKHFERAQSEFGFGYLQRFYLAINLSTAFRKHVSRKDIHSKIIQRFAELYPTYNGTLVIELYYQYQFDCKDDRFIAEMDRVIDRLKAMPPHEYGDYKHVEALLTQHRAQLAWLRGDMLTAFDYAVLGLRDVNTLNAQSLHILLHCMQGQSPEDITLFLNSLLDFSYETVLPFLTQNLRLKGYEDIYIYYQKKQIDQGTATTGDFLYLLLLTSNYQQSVQAALNMLDENNTETIAAHLFMTAILTDDSGIFEENRELLEPYKRVLEAYFSNEPLEQISGPEAQFLQKYYKHIAFAGDLATADRFRALYQNDPGLCYSIKAAHCMTNGLYEEMLAESTEGFELKDPISFFIIRASIMMGQYPAALERIRSQLQETLPTSVLLNDLLVIREKASGAVRKEAGELYDKYIRYYDEYTDLNDIVNTGIVFDTNDKRQRRSLAGMTPAQFRRAFETDQTAFAPSALLEKLQLAAAIYEEKGAVADAAECYRRLAAHDQEPERNWANLQRVFLVAGNQALAQEAERKLELAQKMQAEIEDLQTEN